jgi:predicted CopG family antitoxin
MAKNVALSDEIIKELDRIKSGNESYSQAIKKLLYYQPKTYSERITEVFEPFKEGICKIVSQDMLHPIELFRVICIRIVNRRMFKEDISKLIGILEEYIEELK